MNYLEDTLGRRVIFLTGKGGVGKSTLAWATALACRQAGRKVAVLGWQPEGKASPASAAAWGIEWIGLDTLGAFREYALGFVRFEKIYDSIFDNPVLRTFVIAAPGLADAVVAGKIWDLANKKTFDTLIVDMPSSGHTRSFFRSPLGLKKIFTVGFIARDTERVCQLFSASSTRLDLVTLPEPLPIQECTELKAALDPLHPFSFGFLHINRTLFPVDEASPTLNPTSDWSQFVQTYRSRFQQQQELIAETNGLGLPQVLTPWIPTESWQHTVEKAAQALQSDPTQTNAVPNP